MIEQKIEVMRRNLEKVMEAKNTELFENIKEVE
jgi:hypothetical protein